MIDENWWPSQKEYDPHISEEKWLELLHDKSVFDRNSMIVMRRFFNFGGEATCTELSLKYGKSPNFYNLIVSKLGKRISDKMKITDIAKIDSKRWPVLFIGRYVNKDDNRQGSFIWKLRDELFNALKSIEKELEAYPLYESNEKWLELIKEYKKHLNEDAALNYELYKWETLTYCKDKDINEIQKYLIKDKTNLMYTTALGYSENFIDNPEFEKIIENLCNESVDLKERLSAYKTEIERITTDTKSYFINDERSASVYLTINNPEKYTFYKSSYYGKLCKYLGEVSETSGNCYVHYMNLIEDFQKVLQQEKNLLAVMKEKTKDYYWSEKLVAQNIIFVIFDSLKINMGANDMENLVESTTKLLLNTHNLILHGAPGTGKTHLAKDIASQIICNKNYDELSAEEKENIKEQIGFVQFHPSYDYTDFVEGLRPIHDENDNVIFERKDGVFKAFCKKAVKTENTQNSDNAFNKSWSKLVNYLNENDYIEVPLISNKRKILVELNEYGTGLTNRSYENNEYKKDSWISGKSKFFNKEQLFNIYRDLPGVPNGGHDNYRRAIVKYMKDNFDLPEYIEEKNSIENKKIYIFIIDEINRGELSKIFGELFYNIDPGYRGESGKIATQYQNLVETGDSFYDGFYIPENVYIIGTMNDIDRSVESMDFAFRRRFTFKEITAADTQENILSGDNGLDTSIYDDAITRMNSLNAAIDNVEGLTSAYHIGGSYFLKLKELENDFDLLWNYHLEGLLREYLRGMEDSETLLEELHKAYNLESEDNQ